MKIETLYFGSRWANTYLLTDENGVSALVDPGAPTPRLPKALEGKDVRYILLTHGHYDHITSVSPVKEITGAQVMIHRLDAPMTEDAGLNLSLLAVGRMTASFSPDHLLEDGEELPFGGVRVLHTPGHTPGSVCFIGADFIISGDTLFEGGIGRTDFPGSDLEDMKRSLRRLVNLPGDYAVYPGHGDATTLENERMNNYYINYLIK